MITPTTIFIIILGVAVFFGLLLAWASVAVVKEFERGVVFTLGRYAGTRGPGLRFVLPALQQLQIIDMREQFIDTTPQTLFTRDNVQVKANAVVYYQAWDARKAVIEVADFVNATREAAQSILREGVQQMNLDEIADQDGLANQIQLGVAEKTKPWGLKVNSVKIKELDVDQETARMLARSAEADKNAEARETEAEVEVSIAEKMVRAAAMMQEQPGALQLRYLATLSSLGQKGGTHTIVFPFPTDIKEMLGQDKSGAALTDNLTKLLESPEAIKLLSDLSQGQGDA